MTFQLSLDIAAPPITVFDFIADFTNMTRWYSAVVRVERVGDATGPGALYEVDRQLPGRAARNLVRIETYQCGREVTFRSLNGPTPFVYRYLVEPNSSASRLTLEGTITGEGLPGPAALVGPLAERLFKSGMRDNLGVLKEILEGQAAGQVHDPCDSPHTSNVSGIGPSSR